MEEYGELGERYPVIGDRISGIVSKMQQNLERLELIDPIDLMERFESDLFSLAETMEEQILTQAVAETEKLQSEIDALRLIIDARDNLEKESKKAAAKPKKVKENKDANATKARS